MPVRTIESDFIKRNGITHRTPTDEPIAVIAYTQQTMHGDTEETWQAILEGRDLITKEMDTANDPKLRNDRTRFSCPLPVSYDPWSMLHPDERKEKTWLSKNAVMNIVHGREILKQCGLLDDKGQFLNTSLLNPEDAAVMIASGYGSSGVSISVHDLINDKGPNRVQPSLGTQLYPEQPNARAISHLGMKGAHPLTLAAACASSSQAIVEAIDRLKSGHLFAIAGGVEAVLDDYEDLVIGSFTSVQALSQQNENPNKSSRPFDAKRDGFIASSGIALLGLARLSFAQRIGAKIHAIIERRMVCNEGNLRITQADPEVQARALARMLKIHPDKNTMLVPDWIIAHATSTGLGDRTEAALYHKLFGSLIRKGSDGENDPIELYGPKSVLAHTLGASGANAAITGIQAIRDGILPGMPHLIQPQTYTDAELSHPNFKLKEDDLPVDFFNGINFRRGVSVRKKNPVVLVGNAGFGSHTAYFVIEPA